MNAYSSFLYLLILLDISWEHKLFAFEEINIHRLIVLFHTKINSMEKLFILTLISFELPYFCFDTPLRFWPLLKREGIYRKKLDVITFPLSSSSRGYRRFNGRTTSSKQKALVFKRAKLNYTYIDIKSISEALFSKVSSREAHQKPPEWRVESFDIPKVGFKLLVSASSS